MPSLTPSQRVFGVGLTPIERAFRPPQGMENDPAYNDYARRKFAAADMEDAQRGQVQEALATQEDARAQRAQDRQMQQVEQRATEALRGKSPEEIPNILAQFPELARSRNLGGFTNFAQAVTPSAGQRTLAPSLRAKLPPAAIPHFNKRFAETGDALDSNEYAQRALDHEKFVADVLPDVMAGGGTMEDLQKIRDQIDLGPIERAAFRESWKRRGTGGVKDDHRAEAMKDSIRSMYEALPDTDDAGKPLGIDEILRQRAEIADKAYRTFYPEKFKQEAVAQPVATGGQAAPVATNAPVAAQQQSVTPAIQNIDLSKVPYAQREKYVADIENQAKESEAINKKWHDAQKDLQSKLEKEIGTGNIGNTNYSKLRSFAEAVVNGETTPTGELGTGGEYRMDVPIGHDVLKKLGVSPTKEAFAEPGNRRVGTQKVTYDDLLKIWAKNYLDTAPTTLVPQVPALPIKKAQAVDSLLDSLMKPSNS